MRLLWLASVLRSAGLEVVEHAGWQDRGRDLLGVEGIVWHHTVTGPNWSDGEVCRLLINGRSDLPGPLCQLGLDRRGRYHLIAAGKGNHNGHGQWGNNSLGIEAFNDGIGEPWPKPQMDAYAAGTAALCRHLGMPAGKVLAHRETDPTRKIDPRGIHMPAARDRIAALLAAEEDDMFTDEDRRLLQGVYGFAINTEQVLPQIVATLNELRAMLADVEAGNVTPEEFVDAFRERLAG